MKYKKYGSTQWFKIIDEKTVFNIRDDETISGFGIAERMEKYGIMSIESFPDCTEAEYQEAFTRVNEKLKSYL